MAVSGIRNGLRPLRHAALTVASAAVLAALAGPAQAQGTNVFDELLEKLKDKGVLSDQEYEALKAARDEEITEQRAERRRQALRQAQEAEQKEKTKEAEAKATKFDVNPGIRSMQLFGDVRVRYESRSGEIRTRHPVCPRRSRRAIGGAMRYGSAFVGSSSTRGTTGCGWRPPAATARPG